MKTVPKSDFSTVRRIVGLFKPYRGKAVLSLASIVVTSLFGLMNAFLIRAIFDEAIAQRNLRRLLLYVGLMFVAPVLGSLISMGQSLLNMKIGQSVVRDLRVRLYMHLQRMSLRFYTGTRAGEIQSRLTNDVSGVQGLVVNTGPSTVASLSTVISVVSSMIYISPILTLLSIGLLPIFAVVSYRVGRLRRAANKQRQEGLAGLSTIIYQTLSMNGILLLKTFGRQEQAGEQFDRQSRSLVELEMRQQLVWRKASVVFAIVFSAIPAMIYLIGGWQMIGGTKLLGTSMTAGTLIAFTTLQGRFFNPATQLLLLQSEVQSGLALFDRIFEYLDLPVEISDRPQALVLKASAIRGEVAFKDVFFTYPREAHVGSEPAQAEYGTGVFLPALKGISFEVAAGRMVALVGPSGAGKTTVAHLLPRLYDVDSGAVTIDGHDVRDISLAALSELVGVVTQETYLLHASVRDNLFYAKPHATEDEMIAAAKAADIHERVMECDEGYDTIVGEHGYKLSGGEKQRLSIARIVLKNPPIIILDEATSALDTHSEHLVQQALERLMQGRTTLVIAHRLSTVRAASRILVMDRGEIVERGTHEQLLDCGGLYARLYRQQFGGGAPAVANLYD